jgi:hypothetical protein
MATCRPTKSTQLRQAVVKLEIGQAEPNGRLHLHNEYPLSGLSQGVQTPDRIPRLQHLRVNSTIEDIADFEPGSPLVISPTDSASEAPTPEDGCNVWDLPDTPQHLRDETSNNGARTPITPPSIYKVLKGSIEVPNTNDAILEQAVKSVVETHTFTINRTNCGKKEDQCIDLSQGEDYFSKPDKLFRNLTKQLQASKLYLSTMLRETS